MWRGRLLSQQQQQHVDTHTHTPTTIIFELAHLIKPLHVDLPLSLLQHQMFLLFSSHSSSSPPASPLMNFFIWRFPTDILIFQHHSLLHPPSSTHPLVSSLWFPFCTLQIWVRHPTSCVGGGVEGGGGGGGGVFLFRSHDRCTWFPSYQKAAAASRRHLLTSITAQQANHTKRGEHVRCLSLSDVQTEHKQHRLYLLWDDWDTLFFLSLSLSLCLFWPQLPELSLHQQLLLFVQLSLLVLFPRPPDLWAAAVTLTDKNTRGTRSSLNWPSEPPPPPPQCFVWTFSASCAKADETDKEL